MEDNFYSPGSADLHVRPRAPGSIAKAVALGLLIDVGGSLAGAMLIGIVTTIFMMSHGYTQAEVMSYVLQKGLTSPSVLINLALGICLSALGGYVCASIANRGNYRAVLLMAIMSCVMSLLSSQLSAPGQAWGVTAVMSLLSFGAVLGGGWLYQRRQPCAMAAA